MTKSLCVFVLAQVLYMPAGSATAGLSTDLVHYWAMEEASGEREDTLDPGSADAWLDNNAPDAAEGINDNAVSVSSSEYLSIDVEVMFPSTTFTLAFWVRPTSFETLGTGSPVLSSDTESAGIDILCPGATTDVAFTVWPSETTATITNNPLPANSWHLIVVWFNGTTGAGGIQIDNGDEAVFTGGEFARTTGSMFFPFNALVGMTGRVDEVALWDGRILTSIQRAQIWNDGVGRFYPYV